MVFGVIDALVAISQSLLSNIYPVPELLSKPIISNIYIDLFFIGLFFLVILLSKFLKLTRLFMALAVTLIFSVLVGGVYFTVLVFAVQIPMIVVWKFFIFRKKGDELSKDMGDFGIEKKGKKGKKDEFDMGGDLEDIGKDTGGDFGDLGKDLKMDESIELPGKEKMPDFGDSEKPKQKLCPYCHNQLRYISQYQRYWCDYCKQYR